MWILFGKRFTDLLRYIFTQVSLMIECQTAHLLTSGIGNLDAENCQVNVIQLCGGR